jgi:XRE family aerobic/anaerobic benzoate catabolism transcriptional regulator
MKDLDTDAELLRRLGGRVRRARLDRGLSAREAAEAAGLSLRFYADLERGGANIAYTRLAAVGSALGVAVADLAGATSGDDGADPAVVALVGLRGAGKSTVGPLLAKRLGVRFLELDDRIEEAAALGVTEVFALHGEQWYRRLAREALQQLVRAGERCVVALPGGIVQDGDAWRLVRERTFTAWLKARPKDHMDRVLRQGDRRPMADRANAMEELRSILAAREPLYRQCDAVVDTSRRSAAQVAAAIEASVTRTSRRS